MGLDYLPPFATFLLPIPRTSHRKQSQSTSSGNNSQIWSPTTSSTSSPFTTPISSPTDSSLTVSTCNNYSTYESSQSSLKTKDTPSTSPVTESRSIYRYPSTLRCQKCTTDLAYTSQILSKSFTGRLGRAYLVAPPPQPPFVPSFPPKPRPKAELVNTRVQQPLSRELLTGWHVVADVNCVVCKTVVGWKYINAREKSQRYKIGKFILERERVCIGGTWEDDESLNAQETESGVEMMGEWAYQGCDSTIQFDSSDEEERESLFSGVWDRDAVEKKRNKRLAKKKHASDKKI